MPLRRLTKMSKLELETESKELKAVIAALSTLLKSEDADSQTGALKNLPPSENLSQFARRTRIGAA
jgi:DNA gyrase/topoisomerase IV subunit A